MRNKIQMELNILESIKNYEGVEDLIQILKEFLTHSDEELPKVVNDFKRDCFILGYGLLLLLDENIIGEEYNDQQVDKLYLYNRITKIL